VADGAATAVRNTIVRGPSVALATDGGGTIAASYSDYPFGATTGNVAGGAAAHNLDDVDPLFTDAPRGNFRPLPPSPVVDGGDPAPLAAGASDTDLDVRPRVLDGNGDGSSVRDIGAYEYERAAPSVTALSSPGLVRPGQAIRFEANGTDPNPGEPLAYLWRFDDGATSTNRFTEHFFERPGAHRAVITVTDASGLSATATASVEVKPFAGVRLLTRAARVSRRGVVRLKLSCPADALGHCLGHLHLLRGKRILARRGETVVHRVRLARRGRRLLAHRRKLRVRAELKTRDAAAPRTKTTFPLRLRSPL
jgi:hypothetical protein